MKIYTRKGDAGTTELFGGGRVPKDHPRVAACGAVDELNCHIGAIRAAQPGAEVDRLLARIQNELFVIGADLATPRDAKAALGVHRIEPADAKWLEQAIDQIDARVPPLHSFILPGGTPLAALIHVVRAVCRRAERTVVTLSHPDTIGSGSIVYLNRLSDFLFTLARSINHRDGCAEEPWKP